MKKTIHEGNKLKEYLKQNNLNQAEIASKLGYKTRQGLTYHFDKEILDFEFKQLLRKHGIHLFDETGKLIKAGEAKENDNLLSEPSVTYVTEAQHYKQLYELSEKQISLLNQQVKLQADIIARLEKLLGNE